MAKKYNSKYFKDFSVLYVEDEVETRASTRVILECIFKEVFEAASAKEAMDIYLKHTPDVAIVDIGLPDKNGLELIRQMRQLDPDEPSIVILSASDRIEHLQAAIPLRLEGYLFKPLRVADLFEALARCMTALSAKKKNVIRCENGAIIDLQLGQAIFEEQINKLTRKEAALLQLFIEHKNNFVQSSVIEIELWSDKVVSSGTLKMLIKQLRAKIGKDAIENITNIGYKLKYTNRFEFDE
jgi:DNA-binding response OmpR family regulator